MGFIRILMQRHYSLQPAFRVFWRDKIVTPVKNSLSFRFITILIKSGWENIIYKKWSEYFILWKKIL